VGRGPGATAGLVFVSILAACRPEMGHPESLALLSRATAPARLVRPRLSTGGPYAPCPAPAGNPGDMVCRLDRETASHATAWLARRATALRELLQDDRAARAHHLRGLWMLQFPTLPGAADSAVAELRRAVRATPGDAEAWADLAAAFLVRATTDTDPESMVQAAQAAQRALELDPHSEAAQFNAGLAWDAMGLAAAGAWDDYLLAGGGRSGWRAEARERAAQARRALVPPRDSLRRLMLASAESSAHLGAVLAWDAGWVREVIEAEVLPAWADARRAGDRARADSALALADRLSAALAEASGDALERQAVAAIRIAGRNPTRTALDLLARGHGAFSLGLASYRRGAFGAATAYFEQARSAFARGRSPMQQWAQYWLAVSAYQQSQYGDALARLAPLTESPSPYPVLQAQARRLAGLIYAIGGAWAPAAANLRAAIAALQRGHERQGLISALTTAATVYHRVGLRRVAWRYQHQALVLALSGSSPTERYRALWSLVPQLEFPDGAIRLADRALAEAQRAGDPVLLRAAWWRRAEVHLKFGRFREARQDVARQLAVVDSLPEGRLSATERGNAWLIQGAAWVREDPGHALASLDSAVAVFRAVGFALGEARAELERAAAHLALGQSESADSILSAALSLVERQRSGLADPVMRQALMDRARTTFEQVIAARLDRSDVTGALAALEAMRARVLLEQRREVHRARSAGAAAIREIQARLPPDVAVVEYLVSRHALHVWVLTRDTIAAVSRAVEAVTVEEEVAGLLDALHARLPAADLRRAAALLYARLIAPVATVVQGKRLVIVPDGALHRLAFAVLWDESGGRYLVQEHALATAPSASLYVQLADQIRGLGDSLVRVVAVGDPAIDRAALPLPRLYGAAAEARSVAALYPWSRVFVGAAAQPERVLAAARQAQVLHLAVHAVAQEEPAEAYLVLAPGSAPDAGVVYARDVARQALPRTRVTVLSACGTASGAVSDTEGPMSLARAFLEAGVPAVVASLWAVDDQRTAWLMERFHRALRQEGDPVLALQQAQVAAIASWGEEVEGPAVWAAFEVIGR